MIASPLPATSRRLLTGPRAVAHTVSGARRWPASSHPPCSPQPTERGLPRTMHALSLHSRTANLYARSARGFSSSARALASQAPRRPPGSGWVHLALYDLLEIEPSASASDVKMAYYRLAKKYHPDTNPDAQAKEHFIQIQKAYDVLSDARKRAAYDRFGTTDGSAPPDSGYHDAGNSFGGPKGPPGAAKGMWNPLGNGFDADALFEEMFGAMGPRAASFRKAAAPGEDIRTRVTLTFEEAAMGTAKDAPLSINVSCYECYGSGIRPGRDSHICHNCNGAGTTFWSVHRRTRVATVCTTCGGVGRIVHPSDQCTICHGSGRLREKTTQTIPIPPGVDDGVTMRLEGWGHEPMDGEGQRGDLLVDIHVLPSKTWRRLGDDLVYEATVPFYTATLGGKITVPTLGGTVDVRVPPGTQTSDETVVPGRGLPVLDMSGNVRSSSLLPKGDLRVHFKVGTPRDLTEHQRKVLQDMANEYEGRGTSSSYHSDSADASAESGRSSQFGHYSETGASTPNNAPPSSSNAFRREYSSNGYTTVERAYVYENGQRRAFERRVGPDGKETFRKIDGESGPMGNIFEELKRQGAFAPDLGQPEPDAYTPKSRSSRTALWAFVGMTLIAFGFYRSTTTPTEDPADVHQRQKASGEILSREGQMM